MGTPKLKTSPYSVNQGRLRIHKRLNERTNEIPEGIESIMKSKHNGLGQFIPLKNKEGKKLNNAQYVRLIAEVGDNVELMDKGLLKYCKELVDSGKSETEINIAFGQFVKNTFVKPV
jgi:hypothetical protein